MSDRISGSNFIKRRRNFHSAPHKMGKARSVSYKNMGASLDEGWLDNLCSEK